MIFDTIKFARKGISFDYTTETPTKVLKQQLKQHSFLRVLFNKHKQIVARLGESTITLYCLRIPVIHLGRPVLYLSITDTESGSTVSGKFTFSYFARVVLWFNVIFFFSMLVYSIVRALSAYLNELEWIFYVFAVGILVAVCIVSYLILSWMHSTWKKYQTDMSLIAEFLQASSTQSSDSGRSD
ncbi:MAG: hypothetical protein OXH84_06835 [Gammaproteobacteria bacterium]|nr:hypothetical protein [Gammaproteobacteria bacterium]